MGRILNNAASMRGSETQRLGTCPGGGHKRPNLCMTACGKVLAATRAPAGGAEQGVGLGAWGSARMDWLRRQQFDEYTLQATMTGYLGEFWLNPRGRTVIRVDSVVTCVAGSKASASRSEPPPGKHSTDCTTGTGNCEDEPRRARKLSQQLGVSCCASSGPSGFESRRSSGRTRSTQSLASSTSSRTREQPDTYQRHRAMTQWTKDTAGSG